jgi:hypothetical protein
MVQAYNPSYLGGRDQEDHGLNPAWANSSQDHVSKIPNTKRAGRLAQVVEDMHRESTVNSNLSITKIKNKKKRVRNFV